MKHALRQARTDAAAVITDAGHAAHAYIPARLATPAVYVQPGAPYVSQADDTTYGHVDIRLEIVCVQRSGNHDRVGAILDETLEEVSEALMHAGYAIEEISQPFALTTNGTEYPAAGITIRTDLEII